MPKQTRRPPHACLPTSLPLWQLVFHGAAVPIRFDLRLAVHVCSSAVIGGTRAICRFLKGVEAVELDGAVGVVAQPRRKQGKLRRTQEQTNEEGQPRATSRAARSRTARSLTKRASLAAQVEPQARAIPTFFVCGSTMRVTDLARHVTRPQCLRI